MTAPTCRVVERGNLCFELGEAASCDKCSYNGDVTVCDGYAVITCQLPPEYNYLSLDSDVPWMMMDSQSDDVQVGNGVAFSSNRAFDMSIVQYNPGEYLNDFAFTSSDPVTNLTWTWTTTSEYLYFYYPNMSAPLQNDDDTADYNDDDRCASSCPTHCSNGYTESWTLNGCTVYCKDQPTNGQCLPGGSGCSSSCRSISVGAIIGIAVGGFAFLFIVIAALSYWFCCRVRTPMTQRENEVGTAA
jgi:hypothetical protein